MEQELILKLVELGIDLVIAFGFGVLIKFVIPTLKQKYGNEKFQMVAEYVEYAVRCAEQIFNGTSLGDKKKEYVTNFINGTVLNQMKYQISEEELDVLIESAVNTMNSMKDICIEEEIE